MGNDMAAADTPPAQGTVTDIAGLAALAGVELGHTEWREMTQDRVDAFADVTEDHNFIHVDPARASQTPFGGTIAHGYLTLSLLPDHPAAAERERCRGQHQLRARPRPLPGTTAGR